MNKSVTLRNNKGLNLAVDVEAPDTKNIHPFVMMFHGFKGYKDEGSYTELAKTLLRKGVGSIRFDASGFSDSEFSILLAALTCCIIFFITLSLLEPNIFVKGLNI